MTERIREVMVRGKKTRKLYYKPDNHKWTLASLVKDPMTKDYMITEIKHNVNLPGDTRPLKDNEYIKTVMKHFDFIDTYYAK